VTFSRTAARDLIKKLEDLNVVGSDSVRATTLHSLCFSILRREEVFRLTGRVARPLLKFEQDFLLTDMPDWFAGKRECASRLRAFEAAWARLQSDMPGWPQDEVDRELRRYVWEWCDFHEAMLVGEIVPLALQYLRDNPACSEKRMFSHVLVDEYQDLNRAEQAVIDLLAQHAILLVIAGDEDQSIYGFKYAQPEGLLEFPHSYPDTYDEILQVCGRCPARVIDMASSLIANNAVRMQDKRLQAAPGNLEGDVHNVQWDTLEDETTGLATIIERYLDAGWVNIGRVLVLTPRRLLGYALRDELDRRGIPVHSFFPEEALELRRAQESFTLLTLLAHPRDRVALRCWLGFRERSLRRNEYARLREYCEETGREPWDTLEALVNGNLDLSGTEQLVSRFEILQDLLARLGESTVREVIDELFPEANAETATVRNLALEAEPECSTVAELREGLRVRITQPELPAEGDFVRVMSLHKAKGLGADLVVVAGCIQGFLPTIDSRLSLAERRRQLEEQRRLFYVSITRTTSDLILSRAQLIPLRVAHKQRARFIRRGPKLGQTISSQFMSELGPQVPRAVEGRELLELLGV